MKYQQLLMDFGRSVMRRVRAKPDDLAKPRRNSRLRHDPLLEDFANQLLKAAGCRHLKVRVFWNPALRTTAGMAMWSDRMVVLNPKLVAVSAAEVQRTLRHELAHLLAHHRVGRRRIEAHGLCIKNTLARGKGKRVRAAPRAALVSSARPTANRYPPTAREYPSR